MFHPRYYQNFYEILCWKFYCKRCQPNSLNLVLCSIYIVYLTMLSLVHIVLSNGKIISQKRIGRDIAWRDYGKSRRSKIGIVGARTTMELSTSQILVQDRSFIAWPNFACTSRDSFPFRHVYIEGHAVV
jgi:hypothetical protein